MSAGARVAQERARLEWSQTALAEKVTRLGYKISQTGIDKIEKRDTARPKCLRELSMALGVTQEWLLTGNEPKHPPVDDQIKSVVSEVRSLPPDKQEDVIAQFRALIGVALNKPRNKIGD